MTSSLAVGTAAHNDSPMQMTLRFAPLAVLLLTSVSMLATAQTAAVATAAPPKRVDERGGTPTVVARPPVIDGRLNDVAWAGVPVFSGFVQREMHEGQPVSERT